VFWIAPSLQRQGSSFIKNLPAYSQHVQNLVGTSATLINHFMESTQSHNMEVPLTQLDKIHDYTVNLLNEGITWLQQKIPTIVEALGHLVKSSIGGVFGIFGMLVSLILVPILLFFFLLESPSIKEYWSDYLPLPPSRFKEEVVSLLLEINNTIIFFFRGQLMVSLVDGALIAVALMIFVRLDFAALLGLMVGILGLIPYAGIILCWIPAVIIAAAQFGDWWHPLLVTIIFLVANNVDGIFISPKIVGQSVGLHPIVVILSVITWSIVLGGLLGALLAVPLTASLIVILRRYVWGKIAFEKQL
jgi:predicted PurR-regulated permease PerM